MPVTFRLRALRDGPDAVPYPSRLFRIRTLAIASCLALVLSSLPIFKFWCSSLAGPVEAASTNPPPPPPPPPPEATETVQTVYPLCSKASELLSSYYIIRENTDVLLAQFGPYPQPQAHVGTGLDLLSHLDNATTSLLNTISSLYRSYRHKNLIYPPTVHTALQTRLANLSASVAHLRYSHARNLLYRPEYRQIADIGKTLHRMLSEPPDEEAYRTEAITTRMVWLLDDTIAKSLDSSVQIARFLSERVAEVEARLGEVAGALEATLELGDTWVQGGLFGVHGLLDEQLRSRSSWAGGVGLGWKVDCSGRGWGWGWGSGWGLLDRWFARIQDVNQALGEVRRLDVLVRHALGLAVSTRESVLRTVGLWEGLRDDIEALAEAGRRLDGVRYGDSRDWGKTVYRHSFEDDEELVQGLWRELDDYLESIGDWRQYEHQVKLLGDAYRLQER